MANIRHGLDAFLNDIDDSCHRIESYQFQAPGIFTNAIINKESIMDLLKDAAEHEQALYRINKYSSGGFSSTTAMKKTKYNSNNGASNRNDVRRFDSPHINLFELKPERIDGKSVYVDQRYNDYINSDDDDDKNNVSHIRTAVKIPEITKESWESQHHNGQLFPQAQYQQQQSSPSSSLKSGIRSDDPFTSPSKKHQSQSIQNQSLHYNLIPEAVMQSDNVDKICTSLLHLIAKYPTLVNRQDLYADISEMQQQHQKLSQEIAQLEEVVSQQRVQLNYHNVSMGDLSPAKKTKELTALSQSTEEALSIDEMIQLEEAEIQQLEREVQERTG